MKFTSKDVVSVKHYIGPYFGFFHYNLLTSGLKTKQKNLSSTNYHYRNLFSFTNSAMMINKQCHDDKQTSHT